MSSEAQGGGEGTERGDDPAKAAPATDDSSGPVSQGATRQASGSRLVRMIYWGTFFVVAPILLSSLLVWALSPASGVEHGGALGWVEGAVRDQPVPFAIISFMVFGLLMWRARYH